MTEIGLILGIAIYGLLWFLVLFMVLPIGVRTQGEASSVIPGTSESAPLRPRLRLKFMLTTIFAGVFYGFVHWILTSSWIAAFILDTN